MNLTNPCKATIADLVTVVAPTRNEERNITAFLNSIPAQVFIILADASDDATLAIAQRIRPQGLRALHAGLGIASARQMGALHASTPWVLFSDADVVFDDNFFDRLLPLLKDDQDVVYGVKLSQDAYSRHYRWMARWQQCLHSVGIPAASGSNLVMRQSALESIGGFDLDLSCNEDSEIAWRAKRAGLHVTFASELIVYARDHRRLERGIWRKLWHSVARCALLYLGLLPESLRRSDWGYWRGR